MKVGYTLYEGEEEVRNASVYRDSTAHIEGAVLLTVAVVGGVGNLIIFGATAACAHFRNSSCAFLSHHCFLDSIKSLFCVPFACALLLEIDIPCCNALGAAYIFLMTLTAYNLLAIHINEEYQLTDRHASVRGRDLDDTKQHHLDKKNSFWCVSFGIFMLWFTTVLLHLGVAFLPSSAEFSYDIGNCVFNYGTPKNYVIHVLWTILVTAALVIAIICFTVFFCKLKARMHSEKWTLLHHSISRDVNHTPRSMSVESPGQLLDDTAAVQRHDQQEELHYQFADGAADQAATLQMRLCLRRVVVMLLMVVSFLFFWYPLFILTIMDVNYSHSPQSYRLCMVVAWTHPVTTPFFCGIIYFDMLRMHSMTKSVYSAAIPMRDSTSFSSATFVREEARRQNLHQRFKMYDIGYTNENFSFSNHATPRYLQRSRSEDLCRGQGQAHGQESSQRGNTQDTCCHSQSPYHTYCGLENIYEGGYHEHCPVSPFEYNQPGQGYDLETSDCSGQQSQHRELDPQLDTEVQGLLASPVRRQAYQVPEPSPQRPFRDPDSQETLM